MIAATLKITETFALSTGLRVQKKLLIIQTDIPFRERSVDNRTDRTPPSSGKGYEMKLVKVVLAFGLGFWMNFAQSATLEHSRSMPPQGPDQGSLDIVSIASDDTRLTTLVKALKAADLVSTLQGEGPFTVFAPTNEAFIEAPLPVHPLARASEEGDSWADALTGEISKAIADLPPQANTALPAALLFFDAFMSA
jgi:hypothetical protein